MQRVRVCTCEQCRARKARASKNLKGRIRRLMNRRRRNPPRREQVTTWYWR